MVLYYYTSNGTFISYEGVTTGTFTTPNNCENINFRCYEADYVSNYSNLNIRIEEGTEIISDKQYILNDNNVYEEFNEDKLLLEAEDTVSLNSGVAVNVETASITAPKDGLALAIVHAVFAGTGGGSRYVNIGVISGDITPKANMQVPSGNIGIGISSMRVLDIKTGNIIAPRIEQTSGSAMNVTCRIQLCYL